MSKIWWRRLWQIRRPDFAAMCIIALYFLIFFGPVIATGRFFLAFDSYIEMYPERMTAWGMIRQGTLPLWTPLLLSGYPLLSMAQIGLAYPLTWGYLFLPGHWAEEVYVLAPYLLCPAFTYAYARQLNRSRLASLLAGLAYGYGGLMIIEYTHNGLLPNSTMWTPLVLLAIDRSQTQSFARSWLWTTLFYSLSVFTGIGQGFLFVGLLALAYAVFLSLVQPASRLNSGTNGHKEGWRSLSRWRPVLVTLGAIVTSVFLAAFQILETLRAQRRSIRSDLSFSTFTEGSLRLSMAFKSMIAPLYYQGDLSTAYVPPLAILLAVCALVAGYKQQRDARVFFWLGVALIGSILMLGSNTPVYGLLYYVPIINKFRGASRHAYEWTFAVAILSAYGWDAIGLRMRGVNKPLAQSKRRELFLALIPLALGLLVGLLWWTAIRRVQGPNLRFTSNVPVSTYLGWKLVFTALIFFALWGVLRISLPSWRRGVAACVIAVACFFEPFIIVSRWWWPQAKTSSRITTPTPVTRFLLQFPPHENRIYTSVHLSFDAEHNPQHLFDGQNLSMLFGLQNLAGYEPLILKRYSRALGDVWLDGVTARREANPDPTLYQSHSHVLDLLNATYVVTYSNPLEVPDQRLEKDGIRFARHYDHFTLLPGSSSPVMPLFQASGDTLAIVSTLSDGTVMEQGQLVGMARIHTSEGKVMEKEIRAGVETAEWAHDRPDVRPIVRHRLAPIFDMDNSPNSTFTSYLFWARIPLGKRVDVERVEITSVASGNTHLTIWNTVLFDSSNSNSQVLQLTTFDKEKWRQVYNENNVVIFHNEREMPRAWLTAEAEAVDGEEALRRIRGESEHRFDPRRTALLEVLPANLPALPGGPISPAATANVVSYEPNKLAIETNAETPAVLVVSEINYPGWEATIDGEKSPIHSANFLLRGMVLPAGSHRVEMRYTAPAARNGALLSGFTLLMICGIAFYTHYTSK